MLPLAYREYYQAFLETLKQFQQSLNETDTDFTVLSSIFSQLQEQFQQNIMSLTGEALSGETLSRWQSSQTEIHRTMRLLQTDMMFLKTSRSTDTSQHRLATVRDRVGKLIEFAATLTQHDN
ncbi:MAG: hypothetical protein BRC33_02385 [Cyanobacteria bacterium SW_9_44_58]|nr:MAG: hypothetical protein BRC33_02385 [Cyanobacteria bacterium SW_9_44_58]